MDPALFPGSAGYSPQLTEYEAYFASMPVVVDERSTHQEAPLNSTSDVPVPTVPRPPAPDVGGKVGRSHAFGWTKGILPTSTFRQRFTGRTLVVPNMGVHPVQGPVGFSNRTGRLEAGVNALYSDPVPDPQTVAKMFTQPNPILYEMNRGSVND